MAPIRVIVVGVADAQGDDPTLAAAVALAERTGAVLHAVHAHALPPVMPAPPALELMDPDAAGQYAEALRDRFAASVQRRHPDARIVAHAVAGAGDHAILDQARRQRADLVVVGATHRGRLARALLGTTAQRVLRRSPAPVLVLRETALVPHRVLLTTDLSSTAAGVHEWGMDLVGAVAAPDAELRLLLVVMDGMVPAPLTSEMVCEAATSELSEFLAARDPRDRPVAPVLRFGLPAGEIVAEAERWQADLVILGTHNRPALPRMLLGSVAESALRHLHCHVLVVPPACACAAVGAA